MFPDLLPLASFPQEPTSALLLLSNSQPRAAHLARMPGREFQMC